MRDIRAPDDIVFMRARAPGHLREAPPRYSQGPPMGAGDAARNLPLAAKFFVGDEFRMTARARATLTLREADTRCCRPPGACDPVLLSDRVIDDQGFTSPIS